MDKYPSIKTLWNRDPETKYKTLIEDSWTHPFFYWAKDCNWYGYEKIDGTNIRAIFRPLPRMLYGTDLVDFRGRTDKANIPPFLLDELQRLITPGMFLEAFDLELAGYAPITLYGEGFGARIQKGGGNYGPPSFCLFDIKIGDTWMDQHFVSGISTAMGLGRAPLRFIGSLDDAIHMVRWGITSRWGNFQAEGLVLRPETDVYDKQGNRIVGKIKTKDFPNG